MGCQIVDHPLVRAKLTVLRDAATPLQGFRDALHELSLLVGYEALRDLEEETFTVPTPLQPARGARIRDAIFLMPILRAGLGMAEALSELLPDAPVGHIGMFRDELTLEPRPYYLRVPPGIAEANVVCVDPMLATGNSAVSAIDQLKKAGAKRLRLVCVVGCPQGVERMLSAHPDVPIYLAAIDDGLNERGYIVPGLGDAGDRYYGT
ncbi:MAG TPA: uracil phosphoribosyltransferase [Chthoniobacterales bacterium]|jgi:uracil phosphoribosyltransferase